MNDAQIVPKPDCSSHDRVIDQTIRSRYELIMKAMRGVANQESRRDSLAVMRAVLERSSIVASVEEFDDHQLLITWVGGDRERVGLPGKPRPPRPIAEYAASRSHRLRGGDDAGHRALFVGCAGEEYIRVNADLIRQLEMGIERDDPSVRGPISEETLAEILAYARKVVR